jgi:hypothetical protein
MFDAEMNMGFKMKLLGGDDITNGEEEYSTGLITGRDAEANTNNEDEEFLHDASVFKKNSRQVYMNIKSMFEDKIQRIKFEEQERIENL